MGAASGRGAGPSGGRLALAGVLVLAFAARMLGARHVLVEGGDRVLFAVGDPWYHLRLAEYAWRHFPQFLRFDPYLNHPGGAHVPWPPLYDLLVAGSAHLVGGGVLGLERVAALWPPLLGTATAAAVYAIGRRLGGARLGLGAAALYAVLPASLFFSRVGYADHHAAVSALAATWLWLQMRALGAPAAAGSFVAIAAVRAALVLTWPGSLLYLGVADVALTLVAGAAARAGVLRGEALSLLASAAVVAPVAAWNPAVAGGAFSAIELSWLHPTACLALALWAGASSWAVRAAPLSAAPAPRLLVLLALGAVPLLLLLALPFAREGIAEALVFMGKSDLWNQTNPEQAPLYAAGSGQSLAFSMLGWLCVPLPAVPLAFASVLWRRRGPPEAAVVLLWSLALLAVALGQARFVNDLAPVAAVGLALLLGGAGRGVAGLVGLPRLAAAAAVALGLALLWPALAGDPIPRLLLDVGRAQARAADAGDPALDSPEGSLVRFLETVRAATPETPGFAAREPRPPDYGIAADPSLGHMILYVAHRATPAGNFGPYLADDKLLPTLQLLLAPGAPEASDAAMAALDARYVLTSWLPSYPAGSLMGGLHQGEGSGYGRLRLVAEGPAGGVPLSVLFVPFPPDAVAYKLWERVEGALLEAPAEPGATARATLWVATGAGRRFLYRQEARADASGLARLRVPYATGAEGRVSTPEPYRVRVAGRTLRATVSEEDVRSGAVVPARPE